MARAITRIGSPASDTARLRMRGKDVLRDILGEKSFAEAFYFIVTGREPTAGEARIFDACLIVLMDHGITPTALVARMVENSTPDDIQASLAAGMLMVGSRFAGTMAGAGRILAEGLAHDGDKRAWCADVAARHRARKAFVPGFGHPYYKPEDPRAARMFEIARANGAKGEHIDLIHLLGEEVDRAAGKHLTLNVTGALGAALGEIGFPTEVMRSVAAVGRCAGLAAHILEEKRDPIAPAVIEFANGIEYVEPD